MPDYIFSFNNNRFFVSNGSSIQPIQINVIPSIQQLEQRLYADIIKDASISKSPVDLGLLKQIIRDCFGYTSEIDNYKVTLTNLETAYQTFISPKESVLKNILKTSTVGSNTQISDAKYVFWESGFATKNICRDTSVTRIGTPAGMLDTMNKEESNTYFPQEGVKILFDESFTKILGFPDNMTWGCKGLANNNYNVKIQYSRDIDIKSDISSGNRGNFTQYSLGNAQKNDTISRPFNSINCTKYIKTLMTKELGDVAQIWMYFAYMSISDLTDRTTGLMITTDSVVYFFCALLYLSCIYTGSRAGVISGACTLKYFLAGTDNLKAKLQNMYKIYYDRISSNNSAIIIGLRIMRLDFNIFQYYRLENSTSRLTYGSYNSSQYKTIIQDLFESEIEKLQKIIERAQDQYDSFFTSIGTPADDVILNSQYSSFCTSMDSFKTQQIITKLKTKTYILNPSNLLGKIAQRIGISVPVNIGEINLEPIAIGGKKVGKNKYKGGGDLDFKNKNFGYYECLFLCFIYTKYFSQDYSQDYSQDSDNMNVEINLADINTNQLSTLNYQIFFAVKYDFYVSQLTNNILIDDILHGISDFNEMNIEDVIVEKGSELAEYIYFADDWNEENIKLTQEYNVIFEQNRKKDLTRRGQSQTGLRKNREESRKKQTFGYLGPQKQRDTPKQFTAQMPGLQPNSEMGQNYLPNTRTNFGGRNKKNKNKNKTRKSKSKRKSREKKTRTFRK